MMRLLRQKAFRGGVPASIAALVLALPGIAAAAAHPAPQQLCQVQFAAGGPLYTGVGITVTTPAGNSTSVCRVKVSPPPETIVMTFPDTHWDTVVITRGGWAIVVFH
jgi:hypothetical protein